MPDLTAHFGVAPALLARQRDQWLTADLWEDPAFTHDVRDDAITRFNTDPASHILVASLRTGGMGLNLTASVVFHFDRWWNPAVETQAEDRAHRIGQTRPVQVFAYLSPDGIEENIAQILDAKRTLFDDLIDNFSIDSLRRLDLPALLRAVNA